MSDGRQLHILLAEDDRGVRQVLERFLRLKDCHVVAVPDGVAALAAMDGTDFDVVISDVAMSIVNGIQLWREACDARPHLRARWIFLSAWHSSEVPECAQARFLQKPVDLGAVWSVVSEIAGDRGAP